MLQDTHNFTVEINWSRDYSSKSPKHKVLSRDHTISSSGTSQILASSAKVFHGSSERWNPELLFTAAVSECHMLTFLFLADRAGLTILTYKDIAHCTLKLDPNGIGGNIESVNLTPVIEISKNQNSDLEQTVIEVFNKVKDYCFIRRSISCQVTEIPSFIFN